MLGRALKMAFWVTYDHIGKLFLANLVWLVFVFAPGLPLYSALATGDWAIILMVGVPAALLTFCVGLPVATVGLAYMVKELIDMRDGSVRAMFTGMRGYGFQAVGIGFLYLVAAAALATSVWFYATRLRATAAWLGYALSGLAAWGLVFLLLSAMMVAPALVQKKGGAWQSIKLACLLVLDNPFVHLGLLVLLGVATLLVSLAVPLVFLYGAVSVVLLSSAYEMMARKYARAEEEGGVRDGKGHARPMGAARSADAVREEEEDDYLNRGFRDFLFPWKG